jgi:hypothetical protein
VLTRATFSASPVTMPQAVEKSQGPPASSTPSGHETDL